MAISVMAHSFSVLIVPWRVTQC